MMSSDMGSAVADPKTQLFVLPLLFMVAVYRIRLSVVDLNGVNAALMSALTTFGVGFVIVCSTSRLYRHLAVT